MRTRQTRNIHAVERTAPPPPKFGPRAVHEDRQDTPVHADLPSYLESWGRAMTVREVAHLLEVSDKQIYALVSRNLIPYFRVGGALRFDPFAIAAWLRKQQATAA